MHIGFIGKEADIYLSLMQLGMQPASVVAEKVRLNRVTTYSALRKLVERGLAHMTTRNNMHYFAVEPPEKLLGYAERKEEEWHQLQGKLKDALAKMSVPEHPSASPVTATTYFGIEGCKTLFSQALDADRLVLVLNPLDKPEAYRDLWMEVFFVKLLKRMPSSVHIFTVRKGLRPELIELLEEHGAEVYLLDQMPFSMDMVLCDDTKSAFIAENQGVFSGAMIEGTKELGGLHAFLSRTLSSLAGGFNFLVTPSN